MKNIFLIFCFSINLLNGQNIGKYWFFGDSVGIIFKNNHPIPNLGNNKKYYYDYLKSNDGCAVAFDKHENVLFYSNGESLYNKFGNFITNGKSLNGNNNCNHAVTIVQIYNSDSLINYVFTNDHLGGSNGLQYSIVDMNKYQGQGSVIKKNIFIQNNIAEKILVIPNNNKCDYWLICHELGSARFFVYPITSIGIGLPVISEVGSIQPYGISGEGAKGHISASPDGSKIAMASYFNNEFQLFSFDNKTGIISNPITLNNYPRAWGIEFSSDGTKLYGTQWTYPFVYQFDLNSYNESDINSSAVIVGILSGPNLDTIAGGLQIGPDNKIYIAKWNSKFLGIINNPNNKGLNCNFIDNGVNLSNRFCKAGLPKFVKIQKDSLITKAIKSINVLGIDTSFCSPINFSLSVKHPNPIWFDNSKSQEIIINNAGEYSVMFEDCSYIYFDTIFINEQNCKRDPCLQYCKKIEWMNWTKIDSTNFKGSMSRASVRLNHDSSTFNSTFTSIKINSIEFSPTNIKSMPTLQMPPLNSNKLTHTLYLDIDSILYASKAYILIGNIQNERKLTYSFPQYVILKAFDKSNNQLNLSGVCEVFQDRLDSLLYNDIKLEYQINQILLSVSNSNRKEGGIIVLKGFPDNTSYLKIEQFDELSSETNKLYINVGLSDCCKTWEYEGWGTDRYGVEVIPCTGNNSEYSLNFFMYHNSNTMNSIIYLLHDGKLIKTLYPPNNGYIIHNIPDLIADGKIHTIGFYSNDIYSDCFKWLSYMAPDPFVKPIIKANDTFCENDTLHLKVEKGLKFFWTGPNNFTSLLQYPVINGISEVQSGIYVVTVIDSNGCIGLDSINIFVAKQTSSKYYQTSCDSLEINGEIYKVSGTYTNLIKNLNLCDSLIQLNLTILKSSTALFSLTACDSATINGTTYTRTGMYNQKLISANGCDSTLHIDLNIFTKTAAQIKWAACDSALINGIRYTQSGNYKQLLKNTHQCDSVLDIDLDLSKSTSERQTLSSCDSVLVNGQVLSQTGIYSQVLKNTLQCDSILTIDFTRLQSTSHTLGYKSCDSVVINGQVYTQSGNYTQTLVNANACDSILNLQLEITKSSSENLSIQQCDSVEVNGQIYTQSGNYIQVLQNTAKCDSVLNLNIDILKQTTSTHNQTSCDSVIVNNQLYTTTGVYNQVLKNTNGCDSILTLDLVIHKRSSGILKQTTCDSAIINNVVYKASGMYTQVLKNTFGCDSTLTLDLSIKPGNPTSLDAGKDTTLCDGDILKLHALFSGTADFTWQSSSGRFDNASQLSTNYYPFTIGNQTVYLRAADDCRQWIDSLQLFVIPKQIISVTGDTIIDPCKEITFKASGGTNYIWTPSSLIDCLDPPCSIVKLKATTATRFTITTQGPCVIPANLNLSISQQQTDIYLPNVFSPNGDNINDLFLPVFNCEQLTFYNLQIFDRWGNLVFESTHKDKGWDGRSNNQMMIPGVYPYVIEYEVHSQGRRFKTGELTLTR
jgi:gliding motility-associated-like protein